MSNNKVKGKITKRRCSDCKLIKPLSHFFKDITRLLAKGYRCKPCTLIRSRKATHRIIWNKNNRTKVDEAVKKWKLKHPKKIKAHLLVHKAIKNGTLKKQNCRICGSIEAQAHHPNYNKPLEVVWLCRTHHKDVHFGRIIL